MTLNIDSSIYKSKLQNHTLQKESSSIEKLSSSPSEDSSQAFQNNSSTIIPNPYVTSIIDHSSITIPAEKSSSNKLSKLNLEKYATDLSITYEDLQIPPVSPRSPFYSFPSTPEDQNQPSQPVILPKSTPIKDFLKSLPNNKRKHINLFKHWSNKEPKEEDDKFKLWRINRDTP